MINPSDFQLDSLPSIPFEAACTLKGAKLLPRISAIYFCLKPDGLPVYIGETGNLKNRWKNHHDKQRWCKELDVTRLLWLEVFHTHSDSAKQKNERLEIEKPFIRYYLPELNHQLWQVKGGAGNREVKRLEIQVLRDERFRKIEMS